MQYNVEGNHFKGYEDGLKDEKIDPCAKAQGRVHKTVGESYLSKILELVFRRHSLRVIIMTYKWRRNRDPCYHLG